jgi:hypothetical protein
MRLLDPSSLVKTLDAINEKLLLGEVIPPEEGLEATRWIATRQGEKGGYRGMFAPTQDDFEQGIRVFSGERLACASARHIMGEEAARAVWLLGRQDAQVMTAYRSATTWMQEAADSYRNGTYCCGRCTLAFWRHIWVVDFPNKEELISTGLQVLKVERQDDGRWRRFPFYYTIFTLLDLDLEPAQQELAYARPVMERGMQRIRTSALAQRRKFILEKALARC